MTFIRYFALLVVLLANAASGSEIVKYRVDGKTYFTDDRSKVPRGATIVTEYAATEKPAGSPAKAASNSGELFKVYSVDTRLTESNASWAKFAYKAQIKNLTAEPIVLNAHFEWLDRDGFVIDDAYEYRVALRSNELKIINGYALIDIGPAQKVDTINVNVRLK